MVKLSRTINKSVIPYGDGFLEMLAAERGASLLTLASYQNDLVHFFTITKVPNITTITNQHIQAYICHLSERGMRPSTLARRLSALRQYFHFLMSEQHCSQDPTRSIDLPRQSRNLPKILSEQDVMQLITYTYSDTSPEGLRLTALLEILYATGMRVSELISLPLSILGIQNQSFEAALIIQGKGRKERLVPLTPQAIQSIEAYLTIRNTLLGSNKCSPWLFPSYGNKGYLTRQRFAQLLKNLALNAGIDPAKVSPHVIRHAFATHLLSHGADLLTLQKLLGHADISTTQIYTHINSEHVSKLVHKHHPLSHANERLNSCNIT